MLRVKGLSMDMSEDERRVLQEIESHLAADDPRLAESLQGHRRWLRSRPGAGRWMLSSLGLAAGVLLMAIGVRESGTAGILVALVGYCVLLAATATTVKLVRGADRSPLHAQKQPRAPQVP
jgi:hypothetical protein